MVVMTSDEYIDAIITLVDGNEIDTAIACLKDLKEDLGNIDL